jgi:hypothetical protein
MEDARATSDRLHVDPAHGVQDLAGSPERLREVAELDSPGVICLHEQRLARACYGG